MPGVQGFCLRTVSIVWYRGDSQYQHQYFLLTLVRLQAERKVVCFAVQPDIVDTLVGGNRARHRDTVVLLHVFSR